MLLDLRHDLVETRQSGIQWDAPIKMWEWVMKSPRLYEWGGQAARLGLKTKLDGLVPNPLGAWKQFRDFPDFAPKSFRQLWREREGTPNHD